MKNAWYVYILQCADRTLYTGITKDIEKRVVEHNSSELGAKYTRGRRPVKLVYSRKFNNKSAAAKEEYRIKRLSRTEKLELAKY
ncbi:MAG: GIY-YIG nuclease family protein [Patescibacteria group bacterium]